MQKPRSTWQGRVHPPFLNRYLHETTHNAETFIPDLIIYNDKNGICLMGEVKQIEYCGCQGASGQDRIYSNTKKLDRLYAPEADSPGPFGKKSLDFSWWGRYAILCWIIWRS